MHYILSNSKKNCYNSKGGRKMVKLGELIKAKRAELGLSLREFANLCTMSHSYIRNLEDGDPRTGRNIVPTLEYLEKLAPALSMSLEELLKEIGFIQDITRESIEDLNDSGENNKDGERIRIDNIKSLEEDDLKDFIFDPDSMEYLKLAKELKDKNISVGFIREIFFRR
jgi:transcriptional regulator with XRE-family HTH domain